MGTTLIRHEILVDLTMIQMKIPVHVFNIHVNLMNDLTLLLDDVLLIISLMKLCVMMLI